jgi:hypothetical protein
MAYDSEGLLEELVASCTGLEITWVTETTSPSAIVVTPTLVIEGGTDTVGWSSVVSAIETGAGSVDSGVSVTMLVTVVKML